MNNAEHLALAYVVALHSHAPGWLSDDIYLCLREALGYTIDADLSDTDVDAIDDRATRLTLAASRWYHEHVGTAACQHPPREENP